MTPNLTMRGTEFNKDCSSMNHFSGYGIMLMLFFVCTAGGYGDDGIRPDPDAAVSRIVENFNRDWLFAADDVAHGEAAGCDERAFSPVCLPHTVTPVPHRSIDTSRYAMVSWYRKHFSVPRAWAGKRVALSFEGVAKAATVYCNGHKAGEYLGAYTPFTCDITRLLRCGTDNLLAVRVDSRQRRDIPPEGHDVDYLLFGGIVRDVNLLVTDRFRIDRVYARNDTAGDGCLPVVIRMVNGDTTGQQ